MVKLASSDVSVWRLRVRPMLSVSVDAPVVSDKRGCTRTKQATRKNSSHSSKTHSQNSACDVTSTHVKLEQGQAPNNPARSTHRLNTRGKALQAVGRQGSLASNLASSPYATIRAT